MIYLGASIRKQSDDYLYGWNWFYNGMKGTGYRTRKAAMEAHREKMDNFRPLSVLKELLK